MDRYSQGVKLPSMKIEVFTGKTTGATGAITVTLKHVPKSLGHITAELPYDASEAHRHVRVMASVGKLVMVMFFDYQYIAPAVINSSNSGNAGGDPHAHTFSTSTDDLVVTVVNTGLIPSFTLTYEL